MLTLHRIVRRCAKDHDLSWASFRFLLDAVAASAVRPESRLDAAGALEHPSVALTFDDGTADHAQAGLELAQRGISAVFFVPSAVIDRPGHLTAREIRDLVALGHRVGSHACSDRPLDDAMPAHLVSRQLVESRCRLEDAAGAPVTYFAPPGGVERRLASQELRAAGYTAARSMRWGVYGSLADRWSIPCIPVTEFTLARGWVIGAVRLGTVPAAMRMGWNLKRLMPSGMRRPVRRLLHRAVALRRGAP